ncbi:XkdX family protein [Clostridium tetani]|nr:XkdX family protein [Clostridium tetani]RXI57282.1 XkdX family protein [Clostridium tetani]RXM55464.1 XkdX family protein [Clostridium tetani]
MLKFIREYYLLELYTVEDVKVFVKAKWITQEDYKNITNVDYIE